MMRLPLQISLPVELYRPIVHNLEHNTTALLAIALASRELQLEAERFIYRSMALKSEVDQQKFLTCILECSRRASLVEMYSQDEVSYSGKFRLWSLLCNALNDMRNLKYLAIHTVLITDSPSEFHRRYSFRLSTLDLRGHCSGNTLVVTFLQQQTQLESLSIEWSEEEGYLIATSTCPRLRFLRGNKGAIETFLPGRSVCALAWAPHPADSSSCPTHLASAFNNLRTLSYGGIIGCPDLSLIIRYLQQLEILRIVDPIMNVRENSFPYLSKLSNTFCLYRSSQCYIKRQISIL